MSYQLIRGDALRLPLAGESVHLVCTSPPYFSLRSYRDDGEHFDGQLGAEPTPHHFLVNLWRVLDECWRVLRADGSVFLNLGDKFAGSGGANDNSGLTGPVEKTGSVDRYSSPRVYNRNSGGLRNKSRMLLPHRFALGLIDPEYRAFTEHRAGLTPKEDAPQWVCRMDMVWDKPNGLPESVTDRVAAKHEYWFHLTKSGRYYADLADVREPHAAKSLTHRGGGQSWGDEANPDNNWGDAKVRKIDPRGVLPGSVWEITSEGLTVPDWLEDVDDHFAAFPSEWPRRLILGWSPSGVCVVCGEGRRLQRGRSCEQCGSLVEVHTKTCLECGHGRGAEWQEGRMGNSAMRTEASKPGLHAPRKPQATSTSTEMGGEVCGCPTPDAPTRPAVVLDPFSGTGTTAGVAHALGRHGVGVELSAGYNRLARWRIEDSPLWAKVQEKTYGRPRGAKARRPDPDAGNLFDLLGAE